MPPAQASTKRRVGTAAVDANALANGAKRLRSASYVPACASCALAGDGGKACCKVCGCGSVCVCAASGTFGVRHVVRALEFCGPSDKRAGIASTTENPRGRDVEITAKPMWSVDEADIWDPQACVEYVEDMYEYQRAVEVSARARQAVVQKIATAVE